MTRRNDDLARLALAQSPRLLEVMALVSGPGWDVSAGGHLAAPEGRWHQDRSVPPIGRAGATYRWAWVPERYADADAMWRLALHLGLPFVDPTQPSLNAPAALNADSMHAEAGE